MEKDNRANRYSNQTRARAVGMVLDNLGNHESPPAAIRVIAPKIGCGRDLFPIESAVLNSLCSVSGPRLTLGDTPTGSRSY